MSDIGSIVGGSMIFTIVMIALSCGGALVITVAAIFLVKKMINPYGNLHTTGEPASATVLKYWDTGTTVNDNPMVGFALRVQRANQPLYEAQTKSIISRLSIGKLQEGAIVSVRVDPKDPQKVVIVGF